MRAEVTSSMEETVNEMSGSYEDDNNIPQPPKSLHRPQGDKEEKEGELEMDTMTEEEKQGAVTNRTGLLHQINLPPLQEREGASVRRMRILWQTSLPRTLLRGTFPLPMNATTSLNSTPN